MFLTSVHFTHIIYLVKSMELKNPLYKNIGVHVDICVFTIIMGVIRVLLIKRKNEPFFDFFALPGGSLYNNELIIDCAKRELKEKTGIELDNLFMYNYFDKIDRFPFKRMISIGFIGIIDSNNIKILTDTLETFNADWYDINNIPILAYDHNEILNSAINELKNKIVETNILKSFFPDEFTLPELQNVYESILDVKLDRRNFRKKMLNLNIIEDIDKEIIYKGRHPAKLYRFNKNYNKKNVF